MVGIFNKIKEKRGIIIAVAIVAAIGLFLFNSFSYKFVKLNERQIEILKQSNLPTDMEELDAMQRDAIVEIENMLEYLDKKYDKKFCYNGFRFANKRANQKRELIAYAEGDDPSYQCFSVTKERFGYKDNYDAVLAEPKYIDTLENSLTQVLSNECYKVYSDYIETKNGKIEVIDIVILIDGENIDNKEECFKSICKQMGKYDEINDVAVYFLKNGTTQKTNPGNYKQVIDPDQNILDSYFKD